MGHSGLYLKTSWMFQSSLSQIPLLVCLSLLVQSATEAREVRLLLHAQTSSYNNRTSKRKDLKASSPSACLCPALWARTGNPAEAPISAQESASSWQMEVQKREKSDLVSGPGSSTAGPVLGNQRGYWLISITAWNISEISFPVERHRRKKARNCANPLKD